MQKTSEIQTISEVFRYPLYCVNGKHFADLYRNKISGYADWCEQELGCGFYFNADNIGPYMSLDETCLSNGEVWRLKQAESTVHMLNWAIRSVKFLGVEFD
ncbi:hypothetical protein [Duncaniella muris]|uniref:hypothetical protein n=1 Tax=Duncaniella muris TaxID=2094150 RepID=UPI003F66563D